MEIGLPAIVTRADMCRISFGALCAEFLRLRGACFPSSRQTSGGENII
jgi:hypothetical protein